MIKLRLALPQDSAACAGLLQAWLDDTHWMPKLHTLAETEGWMAGELFPTSQVMLAEAGGILGFLALQGGEIAQMILAPKARGQGVGHRLMAWAKAEVPEGLSLWCFEANEDARRFYLREGFHEARRTEGENAEGLPDIQFRWGPQ